MLCFSICREGNRLAFCQIEQWSELVPGRYGIYEPPESRLPIALSKISWSWFPVWLSIDTEDDWDGAEAITIARS